MQECTAGLIPVRREEGVLSFAAPPTTRSGELDGDDLAQIVQAFGIGPDQVLSHQWVDNGPGWAVIRLATAGEVLDLDPDLSLIPDAMVGAIGAYPAGSEFAFEMRTFAPGVGVAEDPVCGSMNASVGSGSPVPARPARVTGSPRAPSSARPGTSRSPPTLTAPCGWGHHHVVRRHRRGVSGAGRTDPGALGCLGVVRHHSRSGLGLRDRRGPAQLAPCPGRGRMLAGHLLAAMVVAARVGTLVTRFPVVLTALTLVGALYLAWLGVGLLRGPVPAPHATEDTVTGSRDRQAGRGLGVSGLNPKVYLLSFALLPQFTDPTAPWPPAVQLMTLGLVHVATCAAVYLAVGYAARTVLRTRPGAARIVTRLSGAAMITIAAFLLIEKFHLH